MVVLGVGVGLWVPLIGAGWVMVAAVIVATCWWPVMLARLVSSLLVILCAAVWWAHQLKPPDLSSHYDRKTAFVAQIVTDPVMSQRSLWFYAQLVSVENNEQRGRIAVVLPRYPEYQYGDVLSMSGELAPVTEFNTRANVAAETVWPRVTSERQGSVNPFKKFLYQIKRVLIAKIGQIMPEPQAGLLGGLLLGTRGFSQELAEYFRITGTSHIVAISGYNVTIVAGIIDGALKRFGRSVSFYGSLLGVAGLVIITGAEASVVRAGFMGGLLLLARQSGRVYTSLQSVVFSAALMISQNPQLLIYDIGFQLSFAALAGLMYLEPALDQTLPSLPAKDYWLPTLAAQITTTPLLLYHFGNFSFVSMLANFLVLAVIPWAMLAGFTAVVLALLWPASGALAGSVAWLPLKYIIAAVEWCARLPGAAASNIPFPLWAAAVYYLILIGWLNQWKQKFLGYLKLY